MKSKYKILLLGLMLVMALFSAAFSTASYVKAEKSESTAETMAEQDKGQYILKEYKGYVAVYMESDQKNPITVTDIQVSTLRDLDQKLMKTGLKIASRERLMMTLEDLGS